METVSDFALTKREQCPQTLTHMPFSELQSKFHGIALQKTKCRRSDVGQMNNGTLVVREEKVPSQNVGSVGFVVHPSVIHLIDTHEILSLHLTILRLRPLREKSISIINYYPPKSNRIEPNRMKPNLLRFMRS
ncbi:hypothetical protein RB195_015787 [Necator americanus]|uniref:Uncharacterized protein n=1 Tax=Necator americanus TaxID=51031 RepID=A0ABR1E659_NECAM